MFTDQNLNNLKAQSSKILINLRIFELLFSFHSVSLGHSVRLKSNSSDLETLGIRHNNEMRLYNCKKAPLLSEVSEYHGLTCSLFFLVGYQKEVSLATSSLAISVSGINLLFPTIPLFHYSNDTGHGFYISDDVLYILRYALPAYWSRGPRDSQLVPLALPTKVQYKRGNFPGPRLRENVKAIVSHQRIKSI